MSIEKIRAHIRETIKEINEDLKSTSKYDDHAALKGDQDELPDALQKGIIDNSENTMEGAPKEIAQKTNSSTLSEIRQHVRNAINEVMVGMTPITRMNTQNNANNANAGEDTDTAVDKAALGFNTFNMQEWAAIAGIDEKDLSESLDDDTGNDSMLGGDDSPLDNVVDIADAASDSVDEIPGMVVSTVSGDSYDDDVQAMEDEVEDLADEYIANRADPDVFDIRDFLAEIRKR